MKSITIRCTESWKPTIAARYYAERGDGEEYAFGATPRQALAKLEAREANDASRFDLRLAEEVAFLAIGADECFRGGGEKLEVVMDNFGGYMGLMGEVICHAKLLDKRWKQIKGEIPCFGGIWLYDVTERFGREWAESILNEQVLSAEDLLDRIIKDVDSKWPRNSPFLVRV